MAEETDIENGDTLIETGDDETTVVVQPSDPSVSGPDIVAVEEDETDEDEETEDEAAA